MLSISNKPFILSTSNSNNDVCLSTTNDYEPLLRSWFAEVLIFFAETFHVSELYILKTQWMVKGKQALLITIVITSLVFSG